MEFLENYLTDVANAIRKKTGGTELIEAMNFPTEIESIPQTTTGTFQDSKSVSITTNTTTTVTPEEGYDGLKSVAITTNIPPSNLVSNSKFNSNLAANTNQSWTIPATAQYAIITLIQSHDYSGASAVSGTPQCTATAGTLTKKIGTYYESDNQRTHTYVWTLTNTTGSASTVTLKAYYGGGASYGHRHAFASVVY